MKHINLLQKYLLIIAIFLSTFSLDAMRKKMWDVATQTTQFPNRAQSASTRSSTSTELIERKQSPPIKHGPNFDEKPVATTMTGKEFKKLLDEAKKKAVTMKKAESSEEDYLVSTMCNLNLGEGEEEGEEDKNSVRILKSLHELTVQNQTLTQQLRQLKDPEKLEAVFEQIKSKNNILCNIFKSILWLCNQSNKMLMVAGLQVVLPLEEWAKDANIPKEAIYSLQHILAYVGYVATVVTFLIQYRNTAPLKFFLTQQVLMNSLYATMYASMVMFHVLFNIIECNPYDNVVCE